MIIWISLSNKPDTKHMLISKLAKAEEKGSECFKGQEPVPASGPREFLVHSVPTPGFPCELSDNLEALNSGDC